MLSKGNSASTGMRSIAMAIALARRIGAPPPSVFGFGACVSCNRYYVCNEGDDFIYEEAQGLDGDDRTHPFGTEALVRRMWAVQGLITLVEEACV